MTDPVNVPGTSDEHPNWQRKMSFGLEDILGRANVRHLLDEVQAARRS
jgi:4-alpha-glucanotransferase